MLYHAIFATLAGLLIHHGIFIRGEWHIDGRDIVGVHAMLSNVVFRQICKKGVPGRDIFVNTLIVTTCYLGTLFTSMTIYRLFYHRTRLFPGPKLAAVTKFWHIFQIRNGKNHLFLQRLHEEYGSFVRTGPNEISIFHPAGIQALDGWGNDNKRDGWYDILRTRTSVMFTRDEKDHEERRKTWTQALSADSMKYFHPRIADLALSLSQCISQYHGQPIDVNEVMTWFSFDAIGDVMFGEDFGFVNSRSMDPALLTRRRAFAMLGLVRDAVWIAFLAFVYLIFYGRVRAWRRLTRFCEERMRRRVERDANVRKVDLASWFIAENKQLKDSKPSYNRSGLLNGTAITALIAGGDTTRVTLTAVWWFLSKFPEHADRIRNEIADIDVCDANALANLPHLNGVINETLRLVPPDMTGGGRITGRDGLWVGDMFIPPYTKVKAPKYVIMRTSAFKFPNDFIPERWHSQPELVRDKRAFGPFSCGNRECVGKELAYAEIRLVVAILLKHYTVRFAPDYDPETMWRDMRDQITAQPGKVLCVFEPRKKAPG